MEPDETVDHIDRDFTNNSLDNLRIIPRSAHASEDSLRSVNQKLHVACVRCGHLFYRSVNQLRRNSSLGKAGPFCGKKCSGKYGAEVQNNKISKQPPQPFPKLPPTYKPIKNLDIYGSLAQLAEAQVLSTWKSQFESVVTHQNFARLLEEKIKFTNPKIPKNTYKPPRLQKTPNPSVLKECSFCGKNVQILSKNLKSKNFCSQKCWRSFQEKIEWPTVENLISMREDSGSYSALAIKLGVSDNAIRKRLKNHDTRRENRGA